MWSIWHWRDTRQGLYVQVLRERQHLINNDTKSAAKQDCKDFHAQQTSIRLCKGIYREPEEVAFKGFEEVKEECWETAFLHRSTVLYVRRSSTCQAAAAVWLPERGGPWRRSTASDVDTAIEQLGKLKKIARSNRLIAIDP